MSLSAPYLAGHYDSWGNWQRTKFCFVQCSHCNCRPPGGIYYSAAHDKRLLAASETNMKRCKNCDSTDLYNFRLGSDWGTGGSFTPVNPSTPERARDCDMDTFVCASCFTAGDDICVSLVDKP